MTHSRKVRPEGKTASADNARTALAVYPGTSGVTAGTGESAVSGAALWLGLDGTVEATVGVASSSVEAADDGVAVTAGGDKLSSTAKGCAVTVLKEAGGVAATGTIPAALAGEFPLRTARPMPATSTALANATATRRMKGDTFVAITSLWPGFGGTLVSKAGIPTRARLPNRR